MTNVKFYYFNIRGIGDTARLLLHYGKIDFEDIRVSDEQWATTNLKEVSVTHKLPILQIDGHTLIESNAINRFLAKRLGLAGKDEYEQAHVDAVADIVKDFNVAVMPWFYRLKGWIEGSPVEHKAKAFDANVKVYLPIFVNILKQAGSGFVSASGLTWADFTFSEYLLSLSQVEPTLLDEYPTLKEFLARIRQVPQVKDYYATRNEA
uniref:glutathione transferase n=1 Tax=Panagrellus redivivus TaxID=6233 RepID=A0A7E4V9C8_PANRE